MGQVETAIDYHQQALVIAREIGDKRGGGNHLGNLGNAYNNLGQIETAIDYYQQALAISCEIGDKRGEGADLGNLAEELIEANRFDEAIQYAQDYANICEEIRKPATYAYGRIALAHLYKGNLPAARVAIETAQQYDEPVNNHNVSALLGVIALRQGERVVANQAFMKAVEQADALLVHTAQNYDAWDAKGLALCGLALANETPERVAEAVEAYRAARAITGAAGIVKRQVRLLDALAQAHPEGVALLAEARQAAAQQDAAGGE